MQAATRLMGLISEIFSILSLLRYFCFGSVISLSEFIIHITMIFLFQHHAKRYSTNFNVVFTFTENYLSLIFRKINNFVQRFILDHKFVDFTILVVNLTILYC
jgi:hypothetical protein